MLLLQSSYHDNDMAEQVSVDVYSFGLVTRNGKAGSYSFFLAFGLFPTLISKVTVLVDISSTLNKGYFLLISSPASFPVVLLIFVILKVLT